MVKGTFHKTIASLFLQLSFVFLALQNAIEKEFAALAGNQALIVFRVKRLIGIFLNLYWRGEAAFFI